jgi:hypothetical protein
VAYTVETVNSHILSDTRESERVRGERVPKARGLGAVFYLNSKMK